jgi:quercetin dioxygenase-like cupin family protein
MVQRFGCPDHRCFDAQIGFEPKNQNLNSIISNKRKFDMKKVVLKTAIAAALFASASTHVFAGDCPKDQATTGAFLPGETKAKDVTDDVISTVDLSSKGEAFKGFMLRVRKLVVQPGGVVPLHKHDIRAANIYILEGEVTEYRTTCKVPLLHKAGDVTAEFGADLSHWWRNNSAKPTIILSSDLLPPAMVETHDMM